MRKWRTKNENMVIIGNIYWALATGQALLQVLYTYISSLGPYC